MRGWARLTGRRALVAALAASVMAMIPDFVRAAENACAADTRVVANCFDVHGRLRLHANLRLYLWPSGTKRLLAVSYAPDAPVADPPLPANLSAAIRLDNDGFGDFRVCPFEPDRPGRLRRACIASAARLVIRPRKGDAPKR